MVGLGQFLHLGGNLATGRFNRLRRHPNKQTLLVVVKTGANAIFHGRVQRGYVKSIFAVPILRTYSSGKSVANVLGQQNRVLTAARIVAKRLQNGTQLANRHALAKQHLQYLLHFR